MRVKPNVVEPFYNEEYGYTVWEHSDHVLIARGDIRESADVAVNPTYVPKTKGPFDLASVFLTQVEVDVPGITAEDVSTEPVKVEPTEPEESLY